MYGKRPPFAFQFGDDASELLPLIFQKQIDLPDESQMRLATACYDGLSPRGVELLGQQPIGSEDHTPASLPDQLDDERMTAVARSASDIEHRFDTHAGAFGTRVRLFPPIIRPSYQQTIPARPAKQAFVDTTQNTLPERRHRQEAGNRIRLPAEESV